MRESFAFNHLLNASVLAAERQHFSARAALAAIRRSRSRFQKSCQPNGGRLMVGGQWPGFIQRLSEKLASLKIK
jgi:hypothetical protein